MEHLYNAHNATINNFYLEPPYAKQVQRLVGSHGVPIQINAYYTMVIIDAYLTNGNGKCWGAEDIYNELIDNFTQVQFMLAITSFTHDKISSKLQFPLCLNQYKSLLTKAESNVTAPKLLDFISTVRNFSQPLYDKISSKLQFPLCLNQYKSLLTKAESNVTAPKLLDFISTVRNFSQPLYRLKEDANIMQQVKHLKKIIK